MQQEISLKIFLEILETKWNTLVNANHCSKFVLQPNAAERHLY